MSIFRSPMYLDTEVMVPLANYHDIEVMTDVSVSQRDLGERSGKGGLRVNVPVPGAPGIDLSGSRASQSEVTQERVVRSHPANALNKLLDSLHEVDGLTTDLVGTPVRRHQVVEIEADWEVSPSTEVGGVLATMMSAMASNPALADAVEPPPEVFASIVGGQPSQGRVVLDATPEASDAPRVLVLLDSELLVGRATIDDIAEERTVFGQVDAFVSEGDSYSLEKFFLSGFNRSIRRTFPVQGMLESFGPLMGRTMTADDLKVAGPVVVIKAISIY